MKGVAEPDAAGVAAAAGAGVVATPAPAPAPAPAPDIGVELGADTALCWRSGVGALNASGGDDTNANVSRMRFATTAPPTDWRRPALAPKSLAELAPGPTDAAGATAGDTGDGACNTSMTSTDVGGGGAREPVGDGTADAAGSMRPVRNMDGRDLNLNRLPDDAYRDGLDTGATDAPADAAKTPPGADAANAPAGTGATDGGAR